jgi:hypothetical protein
MSGFSIGPEHVAEHIEDIAWYLNRHGTDGLLIYDDDTHVNYSVDELPEGPAIRDLQARIRVARTMLRAKHQHERNELERAHDAEHRELMRNPEIAGLVTIHIGELMAEERERIEKLLEQRKRDAVRHMMGRSPLTAMMTTKPAWQRAATPSGARQ